MTPEPLAPNPAASITRIPVGSSNIRSVGYESGVLVVEFHTGSIYVYQDVRGDVALRFMQSDSAGKFFNQHIRGKFTGAKVTGQCPNCGAAPVLVRVLCPECGTGYGREVETRYTDANWEGAAKVAAELKAMRKIVVGE